MPEMCQSLVKSMPKWLEAVIRSKGDVTSYLVVTLHLKAIVSEIYVIS